MDEDKKIRLPSGCYYVTHTQSTRQSLASVLARIPKPLNTYEFPLRIRFDLEDGRKWISVADGSGRDCLDARS